MNGHDAQKVVTNHHLKLNKTNETYIPIFYDIYKCVFLSNKGSLYEVKDSFQKTYIALLLLLLLLLLQTHFCGLHYKMFHHYANFKS